ncbi:MAG: NAD-dependent dehydratase [Candidatus Melainabacteria bacterium HGW-Melainabacteria-1]|nr:MAG: NAD-dependent dehydratase [Candidatus Melainabacteria bacterium HGW-Melainabacteria-1]
MAAQAPTTLVAGAAGLIGSNLCRALLARGMHVIGLDNFVTGDESNLQELYNHPHFEFVRHDITRRPPAFSLSPQMIYHLASPASPEDFDPLALEIMAVNTLGSWQLLELAQRHGAKLLFTSTSEVYGNPAVHPQREDYWGNVNPVGPRSCYDESKRMAESMLLNHARLKGTRVVIARVFNTYGPRMRARDGRVVPQFLLNALQDQPLTLHGDGSQTRSFCYVDDLVRGLIGLMESNDTDGGIYNLGNPKEFTIAQLAQAVCKVAGKKLPIAQIDSPRVDDPERRCPDISKIQAAIGWQPTVALEAGLALTWQDFSSRFGANP